jgi:hypothetical protein
VRLRWTPPLFPDRGSLQPALPDLLPFVPGWPGQRLQPLFTGDGGLGPAFWPVGEVDVFQLGERFGRFHLGFEFVGEMTVLFQGFQNGFPAAVQLFQLDQAIPDGRYGHLVQAAGGLFPVTGDERNRRSFVKQFGHRLDG